MKTSISIFVTIVLLPVMAYGQDCGKLADGRYRVKFGKQYGGVKYELLLEGDRFRQVTEDGVVEGTIKVNENCTLLLDYKMEWDSTIAVQNVLSKSIPPYFVFERTRGKRLQFRLTGFGGFHITSGEGTFVKLD